MVCYKYVPNLLIVLLVILSRATIGYSSNITTRPRPVREIRRQSYGVINSLKECNGNLDGILSPFSEPKKLKESLCKMEFISYKSSKLELYMIDHAKEIQYMTAARYCTFMNSVYVRNAVEEFVKAMARYQGLSSFRGEMVNTDIFSTMTYRTTCQDGAIYVNTHYIEPLLGLTRHPYALCKGNNWLESLGYVLLQSFEDNLFYRKMNETEQIRFIGMDLGASTWFREQDTKTEWFYEQYGNRGVHFDRMLMWEGNKYTNGEIWKFPPRYTPSFQYFNMFADLNPNAEGNPLRVLHKFARKEDFVMLKLDIDQPKEIRIVWALLEDPNISAIVDEFFFEHHTTTSIMRYYWGKNVACKLTNTYAIFLQLRNMGIRAHGWP